MGPETQEPEPMGVTTPIHFSLPSHPPGPIADAPGLCTIQILNFLIRSHNEICNEIATVCDGQYEDAGETKQTALTVSVETPAIVLKQRLINYHRERDLLPLLFEFSVQSLAIGEGSALDYDFVGLEAALAHRLFMSKRLLALQVRQYLYAGEARARGGLASLRSLLPQEATLPAALLEALVSELDTREQVVRLLGLLEEAIHCLVALSAEPQAAGSGDAKAMLLVTYCATSFGGRESLVGGKFPAICRTAGYLAAYQCALSLGRRAIDGRWRGTIVPRSACKIPCHLA